MKYEWNEDKAVQVQKDHGIRFSGIIDVFNDPFAIEFVDEKHSTEDETRYGIIGLASPGLIYLG